MLTIKSQNCTSSSSFMVSDSKIPLFGLHLNKKNRTKSSYLYFKILVRYLLFKTKYVILGI